MAIGKISGPMLKNNLERQGVDLSIEGNIVYVDVTNRRLGANTTTPNADLQVVGTANIADITISSNAISSVTGAVNFGSNANITISGGEIGRVLTSDGYGSVTWELVSTLATGFGNVTINDNNISSTTQDGNLELSANGNGVVTTTTYNFYAANIYTANVNAQFVNGNVRANDIISTGNITAPWFVGNLDGTIANLSGNVTASYFIGNVEGNVYGNVTAVTVNATGNITAPWFVGNIDGTTVTTTGNITAPYFVGNVEGNVAGNLVGNVSATSVVATGNIDAGFFNGNLRGNDIITGNVISGDSYISSTQVKLQDISVAGNVISSLTTDLVFSANVTDPNNIIRFDSVSALDIAAGTTAQRPPNPDPGYVRYNSDITTVEWWNGTEWTAGSRLIEAETITPDGISKTFTLGQSTLAEGILVNINGTIQQALGGLDAPYTVVGNQITFAEIPETTDIIEIRYLSAGMTSASWYGGTIVNPVNITAITPSTNTTTGALTVHGGVGIVGNINIGGNLSVLSSTGTPSNTTNPAGWLKVYVGGTEYFLPIYQ